MFIFLKYIINVCGFLRNRSQFLVFIVIFVLSASKLVFHCHIRAQRLEISKKWLLLAQKLKVSKNLLCNVIVDH